MANTFLLYGATGYTGALVARAAVARGFAPVLAGRSADSLARLAGELGLEHRAFALDAPDQIDAGIAGVPLVLHCAGPFRETSAPMVAACLRTGVHYLDITGEVGVFEALAAKDAAAKAAGVMLLPGVGFDVVPTDCLAAHLKRRLPTATHLSLAFGGMGGVSRGTALTAVGGTGYGSGGLVRAGGSLTEVPLSYKSRLIDLGEGPVAARTIPWGDVSTAYATTGIPNIEVYLAGAPGVPGGRAGGAIVEAVLRSYTGRRILQEVVRRTIHGPSDEARARGRSLIWGEAADATGRRAVSRLRAPEAYSLTVDTALACAGRVLAGERKPGFQTPAGVYGPDLILSIPGVTRTDEEIQ